MLHNILMPVNIFQHDEQEAIYRSFKKHQMHRRYEQAMLMGVQMDHPDRKQNYTAMDVHRMRDRDGSIPSAWQGHSGLGFNSDLTPWEYEGLHINPLTGEVDLQVCI